MTAPEIPDESRIGVADVVDRIRCELKTVVSKPKYQRDENLQKKLDKYENEAKKKIEKSNISPADPRYERLLQRAERAIYDSRPENARYLKGNFINETAVAFILTLQVKDFAGIANHGASATWSAIPIPSGLFSFKVTGGFNGSARKTATFKASLYMAEVTDWNDNGKCSQLASTWNSTVRLDGNFGIAAWLERVMDAAFETGTVKHFTSAGETVDFILTPTLGVTPAWAIVHPNKTKFDGTFGLAAQRDYQNTLDFVVASIQEPPLPSVVYVSNLPPLPPAVAKALPRDKRKFQDLKTTKGAVDSATQQRLDSGLFELQQRGFLRVPQ